MSQIRSWVRGKARLGAPWGVSAEPKGETHLGGPHILTHRIVRFYFGQAGHIQNIGGEPSFLWGTAQRKKSRLLQALATKSRSGNNLKCNKQAHTQPITVEFPSLDWKFVMLSPVQLGRIICLEAALMRHRASSLPPPVNACGQGLSLTQWLGLPGGKSPSTSNPARPLQWAKNVFFLC